jgi:hypothetical protein
MSLRLVALLGALSMAVGQAPAQEIKTNRQGKDR